MKILTLWTVALLLPLASPVASAANLPDLPVGGCYHASKAIPNGGIVKIEVPNPEGRAWFQQCRDGEFALPFTLTDNGPESLLIGVCHYGGKVISDGDFAKNNFTVEGRASYQQCRDGVFGPNFTAADLPAE